MTGGSLARPAAARAVPGNTHRAPPVRFNVPRTRLLTTLGTAALAAGLVLVASPLLAATPSRGSNPRAATVQKVFPSAVRVQVLAGGEVKRSASGIGFARDGGRTYVLTNAHVVELGKGWGAPVEVRVLPTGARAAALAATVVACGKVPDSDLAVLAVDAELPVTPLGSDDGLELGDDLVVIGAPFGKGLSVAAGIVSQVEYEYAEAAAAPRVPKAMKTDAAIGYGSSGGGVFDVPSGRLVGLVEGYRTARVAFGGKEQDEYAFDVPMPGETFVAPAAKIRRFLHEHGLTRLAPGAAATASTAEAPAVVPAASRM